MSDREPWSLACIAPLALSILCMAPTAITLLLVVGMAAVTVASTLLSVGLTLSPEAGLWGFIWSVVASFLLSLVTGGPVACCSVVLHPIGAMTAIGASRAGAPRSGTVLLVMHVVTFFIGAIVGAAWLVYVGAPLVD